MDALNSSLLAGATALVALGIGVAALMLSRSGFDYMMSRGNPRNVAQAHDSVIRVIQGAILVIGAALISGIIFATIKFG
jgi:sulfite exporter TauE/SafE